MTEAVLVLGAAGFIGTTLRCSLSRRYRLWSVDIRPITPLGGGGGLHPERSLRADLGDPEQIDLLFDAMGEDVSELAGVVHLAAYYDFRNRSDPRYERLEAALPHLLRRLEAVPADVPLLFASSMAALESTEPGVPIGPDSPRYGGWAYPRHKLAMERILEENPTRPVGELVLAAVYSDFCELVPLTQQIERIRRRSLEAWLYPASPDRGLTYVHVDDAVRAFELAIERLRGRPGVHRLMIGEDEPVTYAEIHERASRGIHGRVRPIVRVPRVIAAVGTSVLGWLADRFGARRFVRPWMVRYAGEHFELDTSATTRELGWRPRRSLRQSLDRIVACAATQPELWKEVNRARPW